MNISFAGCGFLGIYHIGVASCFREHAPYLLVNKIAGASVGSIAAAALICKVPLGQTTTDVIKVAVKARARALGPFHPGFDLNSILREALEKSLPENAHILCSGRLFISCTRLPGGDNVLLSEYKTRAQLIEALQASCFIPFYSGFNCPQYSEGGYIVDGGLSNNLPVLDESTITVSPFAGEHDICPQDDICNIMQINVANTSISLCRGNLYRLQRILFPPEPEVLSKMCQQGFDDALKYLQRHNLIACTRCMAVQASLTLSDACNLGYKNSTSSEHAYDDCEDCRHRQQMALLGNLPESVVKAIEDACEEVNKGVINWLFKNRPMKLLSILGLPYVLPIDISILIFCKIWQKLPLLQKEIRSRFDSIMMLIKTLLHKVDTSRHKYSAKFSCQLAITEFDYTEESVNSSFAAPSADRPKHDIFTLVTEEKESSLKRQATLKVPQPLSLAEAKQQRRSYAGMPHAKKDSGTEKHRRKSMCEVRHPERVLRNMKFGFVMDLENSEKKKETPLSTFESLGEEEPDISVIEITNKALSFERECLNQYHGDLQPESAEMRKILDLTAKEAVMSYYYLDDDKTVKVTELFNVNHDDTSIIAPDKQPPVDSKMQLASEWYADPNIGCYDPSSSLAETFDDQEFSMSDNEDECKNEDYPGALPELSCQTSLEEKIINTKPKRKTSFIIVN